MELKYWTSGWLWWSRRRWCVRVPPLLEKQEKSSSIESCLLVFIPFSKKIKAPPNKLRLLAACLCVDSPYRARRTKRNHNIGDVGGTVSRGFLDGKRSCEEKSHRESQQEACVIILWKTHALVYGAMRYLQDNEGEICGSWEVAVDLNFQLPSGDKLKITLNGMKWAITGLLSFAHKQNLSKQVQFPDLFQTWMWQFASINVCLLMQQMFARLTVNTPGIFLIPFVIARTRRIPSILGN